MEQKKETEKEPKYGEEGYSRSKYENKEGLTKSDILSMNLTETVKNWVEEQGYKQYDVNIEELKTLFKEPEIFIQQIITEEDEITIAKNVNMLKFKPLSNPKFRYIKKDFKVAFGGVITGLFCEEDKNDNKAENYHIRYKTFNPVAIISVQLKNVLNLFITEVNHTKNHDNLETKVLKVEEALKDVLKDHKTASSMWNFVSNQRRNDPTYVKGISQTMIRAYYKDKKEKATKAENENKNVKSEN